MKKIFVSSTIWDLIDIRSELKEFLSRNGFEPIMSEYEGFIDDLQQDGSYDKCKKALEQCDIFLMLINSRYGGSRNKTEPISITHQEFRWSVDFDKRFICFIRDRAEHDMKTWKDNKRDPNVKLGFIERNNIKLFDLIEEINTSGPDGSALWWRPFKDSIDLKRQLAVKLGIDDYSSNYLAQAQMINALPKITVISTGSNHTGTRLNLSLTVENFGNGNAIGVQFFLFNSNNTCLKECLFHGISSANGKNVPVTLEIPRKNATHNCAAF